MPQKRTAARGAKSPSTQAGEYVREEMDHIRQGEHGARSTKQAIAIGLSKALRAGVKLPPRPASVAMQLGASQRGSGTPNRAKPDRRNSSRSTWPVSWKIEVMIPCRSTSNPARRAVPARNVLE